MMGRRELSLVPVYKVLVVSAALLGTLSLISGKDLIHVRPTDDTSGVTSKELEFNIKNVWLKFYSISVNSCGTDEFLCKDKLKCVSKDVICDGTLDCFDRSDEELNCGIIFKINNRYSEES